MLNMYHGTYDLYGARVHNKYAYIGKTHSIHTPVQSFQREGTFITVSYLKITAYR